jgi:formate hydrogenlyase subunit 3/multisubunit Na+/H+ antiporter MnhD subunit
MGSYGMMAGVIFFLVFVGVAYIAFRLLKRTVKMAIRMVIVAIILGVAVVGGISLLWFGTGAVEKTKPAPTRAR